MKLILSAALGLLFCMSAVAQTATAPSSEVAARPAEAAPPKAEAARQDKDEDRLICKNEQMVGSRQTKRVCRSADTARTYRDAAQDYTRQGQRTLQAISGGGG